MTEELRSGLRRVRLAWRWKDSGISGSGPWTHRFDLVEAWLESMVERSGERVDHWIEQEPAAEEGPAAVVHADARPDNRSDARRHGTLV